MGKDTQAGLMGIAPYPGLWKGKAISIALVGIRMIIGNETMMMCFQRHSVAASRTVQAHEII